MTSGNSIRLIVVILATMITIIADATIKKISKDGSLGSVLKSPWMIAVYALYFLQILSAIFIFVHKGEFAVYTNLFVVFYSIFGVAFGILFFQESLSLAQWAGIALALSGVVLINGFVEQLILLNCHLVIFKRKSHFLLAI
jgi:drug/metabolite transporter (DMT)-like permease